MTRLLKSNIAWICLDADGRVDSATLVEYTDPQELAALRRAGRNPQLVDFGDEPITIPGPIPATARILT